MAKTENKPVVFGLLGKNISYSFSKAYFTEKFIHLGLHSHVYKNFDIQDIKAFPKLIKNQKSLSGMNVTIPYKEDIIPFLDDLDEKAAEIGAVNTIKFLKGKLIGFNTDIYGFQKSLEPHLKPQHRQALILGTGGASKAVAYVFKKTGVKFRFVSRKPETGQLSYADLDQNILEAHTVIINCTPLGTFPDVTLKPNIPYPWISQNHLLFDLIYNPEKTAFLKEGEQRGAAICNGIRMLQLQAEKAWEIWNS